MSANQRVHGGPDALGAPQYDFSTNSNACGPCPQALAAVQAADATRYPDAGYTALRAALAAFHTVAPWRIVLAGSASEFIFRMTGWVRQQGRQTVSLPPHAYGDYAHAAQAWGLQTLPEPRAELGAQRDAPFNASDLIWACEPSSPLGQAHKHWPQWLVSQEANGSTAQTKLLVLDCAYAPLRLSGIDSLNAAQRDSVWQLFSPNKSLGLTGVRAAYAIAPLGSESAVQQFNALAPSWVVGAHGVAMLTAWTQADVQAWLAQSRDTLGLWKSLQIDGLVQRGWKCLPSEANYLCAQPPQGLDAGPLCARLREQGLKLRDATSFGLPGWVRLGVLSPLAQDALFATLELTT
jgi:histidinol-phosphate aminotransferase